MLSANLKEPRWYCVRLQPKREHVATAHLRRLSGVEIYCPLIRLKKRGRGGSAWNTEALFPGYLFARFDFVTWHRDVHYAHGVSHIVKFGEDYPSVPEALMADLQRRFGTEPVTQLTPPLSVGSAVRIVAGPFCGFVSVVTRLPVGAQRVRVLLEVLGQSVEAELSSASVIAEMVHPLTVHG